MDADPNGLVAGAVAGPGSQVFRQRTMVGAALLAGATLLVLGQHQIRVLETNTSAGLDRLLHVANAQTFGLTVIFPNGGHLDGYQLTLGCTAALLVAPFFILTGFLIASGRIKVRVGLASLGAVSALMFAVNQIRLLIIAGSMRLWGFHTGYELSHVFLGTLLSTIGVVVGIVVFAFLLLGTRIMPGHAGTPGTAGTEAN